MLLSSWSVRSTSNRVAYLDLADVDAV